MVPLHTGRDSIASMFNSISARYDLLNHLLSFGVDRFWRRAVVRRIQAEKVVNVLDIACGTGDLTIALWKKGLNVTGVDIAEKMVEIAKKKSSVLNISEKAAPQYIIAPAESLPFGHNSYDAVTIGFGIRNFEDRKKALSEIKRVLRPGGFLAVLEFSTARNPVWRKIFCFYFFKILPIIGRIISNDSQAYRYLPESVRKFPTPAEFCEELKISGFEKLSAISKTGGIAVTYFGYKT